MYQRNAHTLLGGKDNSLNEQSQPVRCDEAVTDRTGAEPRAYTYRKYISLCIGKSNHVRVMFCQAQSSFGAVTSILKTPMRSKIPWSLVSLIQRPST